MWNTWKVWRIYLWWFGKEGREYFNHFICYLLIPENRWCSGFTVTYFEWFTIGSKYRFPGTLGIPASILYFTVKNGKHYLRFPYFSVVSRLSLELESVGASEFSYSKETSYPLTIQKCISEIELIQKYLMVSFTCSLKLWVMRDSPLPAVNTTGE